jgi:uncharacterized protein
MRKSLIVLKNQFDWMKKDALMLVTVNILSGMLIYFYNFHFLIEFMVTILLVLKSINFSLYASIIPTVNSDLGRFSWKYFQGLAINKKELLVTVALSRLLTLIPLLIWLIAFFPQINGYIDEVHGFKVESLLKVLAVFIISIVISGFSTVGSLINFPRTQFQKKNSKEALYVSIKRLLLGSLFLLYSFLALVILREKFDVDVLKYLEMMIDLIEDLFVSWWLPVALIFLGIVSYIWTCKIWGDERPSYVKFNWDSNKDVKVVIASVVLLALPIFLADFTTPLIYRGEKILRLVYEKDLIALNSYLQRNGTTKLFIQNKYGFTPLMVAVHEGNLEAYHFLKGAGAEYRGEVVVKNENRHNGHSLIFLAVDSYSVTMLQEILNSGESPVTVNKVSGNYPLHIAARSCRAELVDILIKRGAKVDVQNEKGSTPLHLAAGQGCFGPVVSLFEAGADVGIRDNNGKLPIDLVVRDVYRELLYYLKKHSAVSVEQ